MQNLIPQSDDPRQSVSATYDPLHQQQDSESGVNSSKRQKSRHRASIACATCRERRIRCVVPPGDHGCVQCARSGTECVIKNDDERRRPISRAYMIALTERVSMLESLLKEKGTEVPPVHYPPKTTRGSLYADGDDSPVRRPEVQSHVPPKIEQQSPQSFHDGSSLSAENRSDKNSHIGTPVDDKKEGLIRRLLSTRGHLSFDQLSGRLRFYGGTVNCHVYSELGEVDDGEGHRIEQARRAQKCIRTLSVETHDYLLDLFWQHYNSVLHVVHQEAFNEDRAHGRTQFYSGFLHVCILAMAFRFSDKSRPDMQRIALPNRESSLHREAKYMLDLELEHPGGVPSIAALLILGDSEVGVGRDNVGWMYAGMAMRLCYDLGLQLDSRSAGLSQREMDVRRTTLWACVIYDRYWSLFLGRPLTMKSRDLEVYSLTDQFGRLGTCMPGGAGQSLNTKIYEALIELMEIAGKIVEEAEFRKNHDTSQSPDQPAYFKMAALDREIHNWAARLAPELRWNEENKLNAPLSYYLLHQQFHAVLILLHRPFARYDDAGSTDPEEANALDSHFSQASREICTKSAVMMARMFWQHRQRFDGKTIFCIGMQHAGAAATALIAALAYMPDAAERHNNLHHLEVLHAALQDMTHAYSPAEQMAAVLNAVMTELRGGPISPSAANAPRRGSVDLEVDRGTAKRRQTSHTRDAKAMPPPPINHSNSRRPSLAAPENSFQSLPQQIVPQEYVMAPPPQHNVWPGHVPNEHIQTPQMMVPPHAVPLPPSPSTRQPWSHSPIHPQGVPHSIPQYTNIAGTPGVLTGDMIHLEFLNGMPMEQNWAGWHTQANVPVTATDLDGYTPRDRYGTNYQNHPNGGEYQNAPNGGHMNGHSHGHGT
ncbi:hypothetical protein Slin15195_G087470 [Septoria linicola]|uniref:Zn(2)-C6 fungal-type domain-containing protein n=1 Tax=Septoria linicola TaxID=215465 RepID=A0A9Q9ENF5_9PEZI|nr:hypothetical protein Slin14017_G090060 [Septoria linicola]USW55428.1 hypothetical protein Slin15195_G087470 [Septoria linicola]